MRWKAAFARRAGFGALVGLAGCISLARTEPVQQHFVLGATSVLRDAPPPFPTASDLAIGLRRPKVAPYLDSPFMVVRRGANQVDFAEFHRWGEPLEAGINRVVAGALIAGGFREVAVAPWPAKGRYGHVIQLTVVRFEGLAPEDPDATEGSVLLVATWEIIRQQDREVIARGTTDFQREGWLVGDYADLVGLLDEGLAALAGDLAAALGKP